MRDLPVLNVLISYRLKEGSRVNVVRKSGGNAHSVGVSPHATISRG